jgi:hypothetical protein
MAAEADGQLEERLAALNEPMPQLFLQVAAFLHGEERGKVLDVWRAQYGQDEADRYLAGLKGEGFLSRGPSGEITIDDTRRDMGRHLLRFNENYRGLCLWVESDGRLVVPDEPQVC